MVAIPLIQGTLVAEDYEDQVAKDLLIDTLRDKMMVKEDKLFSQDYLDPEKRSIANSIQIFFKDGSSTEKVTVEYPIGHRRRRAEGIPVLKTKFAQSLATRFPKVQVAKILAACEAQHALEEMSVLDFMALWQI
jgi:2-methylcitrate dehydratase